MKSEKISELTTNRLSVYLRCLNVLADAGVQTVSSKTLAEQFQLNPAQIRKDLAYFGEFGTRGVGYSVKELREHLTKILGLDRARRVGIVGAGNLGTALANYNGFKDSNFETRALFDNRSPTSSRARSRRARRTRAPARTATKTSRRATSRSYKNPHQKRRQP
ncbi:MAG: redox-sensing transcriptional repressor Rex [Acidobacteria bacterium]|nr:redox-sensing transcriptional repressor Rex [Acidobacteriota bacterium]